MRYGVLVVCAVLGIAHILVACTRSEPSLPDSSATINAKNGRVTAVIADISPGTNPYHEIFRRPWFDHPCNVIPGFPCDAPALPLSLGPHYATNLQNDSGVWDSYQPGVVYWVPGTNLLLLTLRTFETLLSSSGTPLYDIRDGYVGKDPASLHGLGTAGAVTKACPECYALVVQDSASLDGLPVQVIVDQMPWVDFVTHTNFPGHPNDGFMDEETRQLHDSGRLYFAASGNTVINGIIGTVYLPNYSMPSWVAQVGGAQGPHWNEPMDCNAVQTIAGKPTEFSGDFIHQLPRVQSVDQYSVSAGTSFATPQIAARFGLALIRLRQHLGDQRAQGALWAGAAGGSSYLADGLLTADELRAAMSLTARYFAPQDYNPLCAGSSSTNDGSQFGATQAPASPAPWVEMGWGFIGPAEAEQAAEIILGASPPSKPIPATAYMNAYTQVRRDFYDTGTIPPLIP